MTELLGEIDPVAVEKLLATGASIEAIAQALHAIEHDVAFGEIQHQACSSRDAQVRAILEELVFEDLNEPERDQEVVRV